MIEKGTVTTIWLNRPEVRNAMDDVMIAELTEVYLELGSEAGIRALVLRGKGKSFCAGADLNYMKNIAGFGYDENVRDGERLAGLFLAIYHCPVPTVALVHGSAFGGANGLLAACDIVIAEEGSQFAFSEVKLGITPATISPFVIRRIGEYGARELMITGKRFDGAEALKWKLVNYLTGAGQMEIALHDVLQQILSSGPVAVRETKRLINEVMTSHDADELTAYTAQMIAHMRGSAECQEGMSAFLEKRKPNWVQQIDTDE